MQTSGHAVVIMAKASTPGRCKTRLVPPLTFEEAAQFNTVFLQDVAANLLAASARIALQPFATCHPAGSEPFFAETLPQGFRMLHPVVAGLPFALGFSCRTLLDQGFRSVCLVNSDSPDLPVEYLVEAVATLAAPRTAQARERIVLGPAEDGGYYLIGVSRWHPRLFEDIAWSTDAVLEQTLARADEIGVDVHRLPTWYDVDDLASLQRLAQGIGADAGSGRSRHSAALLQALEAAGRFPAVPTGRRGDED